MFPQTDQDDKSIPKSKHLGPCSVSGIKLNQFRIIISKVDHQNYGFEIKIDPKPVCARCQKVHGKAIKDEEVDDDDG